SSLPGLRLPSTGSARVRVRRLRRYYSKTPTSPAPSAPFSGRRTAASCALRSVRHCTTTGGLGHFSDGARTVSFATEKPETSQVPGEPLARMPRSSTPVDRWLLASLGTSDAAFRSENDVGSTITSFRGSITRPTCSLCTLRSQARACTTQHSVPAGG